LVKTVNGEDVYVITNELYLNKKWRFNNYNKRLNMKIKEILDEIANISGKTIRVKY
jgi:hypothetical protein